LGHVLFEKINPEDYGSIILAMWTSVILVGTNPFPDEYLVVA